MSELRLKGEWAWAGRGDRMGKQPVGEQRVGWGIERCLVSRV